ncbi:metal ABC transporter substrate-binding protein [Dactylosporangium sp. NPDC005572]|uniref:metal ABC transporter substrate-binding protein n=1 Tax=Dactylosporangium sp. NPDC005572 TaxID=3156889 RepID=UPI0033BCDE94
MLRRGIVAGLTALAVVAGAGACGDDQAGGGGGTQVVAAFYPLQFISERVGGDGVRVTNLTKAGAEPHDLELQPGQLATIEDADLIVYLSGFQPAVDEAVQQEAKDKAFDVATVETLKEGSGDEEHGKDPHVWLDPVRLSVIVGKLSERLQQVDGADVSGITTRAAKLQGELQQLDQEYQSGLKTCQRRDIVTSHAAFGYLAARYGLNQVSISGLDPEEEPSPQRVAEVAQLAKEKGVTTIFFEALVSPKLSETVAKEIGAKAAVLDPIEGVEGDATYFSVMRANLTALKDALGCG